MEQPSEVVVKSIKEQYPQEADSILEELKYDSIMGCWCFILNGMFLGVEKDGYIHS